MDKRLWRKEVKTKATLLTFFTAAIAIGSSLYFYRQSTQGASEATFEKIKVEPGNIALKIQATGSVLPLNRLVIKPPISGRIDKTLVESGEQVKKGQIIAWMSSVDRAALLDAARARGPEEIRHWEELYKATPIIAPMSGLVIAKAVEPGQVISVNDQIYVISDRLMVTAQVDETDMARVKLGQEVNVTVDAYPNEKVLGKVTRIAFEAKTVNNVTLYEILIEPRTPAPFMRSGMTTTVQFILDERSDVATLPATAIKYLDSKTFVLKGTIDKKGRLEDVKTPEKIPVELGLSDGKMVEIAKGLSVGDEVLQENIILSDPNKKSSPFGPQSPNKKKSSKVH